MSAAFPGSILLRQDSEGVSHFAVEPSSVLTVAALHTRRTLNMYSPIHPQVFPEGQAPRAGNSLRRRSETAARRSEQDGQQRQDPRRNRPGQGASGRCTATQNAISPIDARRSRYISLDFSNANLCMYSRSRVSVSSAKAAS